MCDVTVISPLQRDRVKGAAEEAGSALVFAFRRKMTASFEACREQGIHFLPLPVETLGGWHKTAIDTVTKLARQLARHTGREEGETTRHLFQRLCVAHEG